MLHHSVIPTIIERKDGDNKPVLFNMKFGKRSTGEIIEANQVQCTSSHFQPRTYNIKFSNNEIRKVRHILITELNGERIYR
jgi:hypothetical protein